MRLDQLLVSKGFVESRSLAQKLVKQSCVMLKVAGQWQTITRASYQVDEHTEIKIKDNELQKYVSRAGLKLEGALRRTRFSVAGLTVLDVGQSTGGFTDCLLQHGANRVMGVDVGHGQLHEKLRADLRVVCLEGVNARALSSQESLGEYAGEISLVVMDLSFISQKLVLPELCELLARPFSLISLVKPQFEVGPEGIGKGGLVKNPQLYGDVEQGICDTLTELDFAVLDYFTSPIEGGDGNKEFFVYAKSL